MIPDSPRAFASHLPAVIIGGGACGMVAALTLADAGIDCVVIERDAAPQGSTALSSGFIPACGTRWQKMLGVHDTLELLTADIEHKNQHGSHAAVTRAACAASAPTLEWLADRHGIAFHVLEGFLYPGHSVARMHAVAGKTGAGLMGRLAQAAGQAGVTLLTEARVIDLFAAADNPPRITGVRVQRPDRSIEDIGCGALLLACNGFGGNRAMVAQYIPAIANATYAGHTGNQGDAMRWGAALGAQLADMGAYQGHGSWATPHGALVTWALMMEGGIQVNAAGQRFWNEHEGYSEASQHVIAQPGGFAWNVYDARLHQLGLTFPDYAELFKTGAIKCAETLGGLASQMQVPQDALVATVSGVVAWKNAAPASGTSEGAAGVAGVAGVADAAEVGAAHSGRCRFGRDFTAKPALQAPYYAVKVTGALFHTQGGLAIDTNARVLKPDGTPFPNLYAGGGAARGLSGAHVWGYLSGNGLLSAVTLGRIAAQHIAMQRSAK